MDVSEILVIATLVLIIGFSTIYHNQVKHAILGPDNKLQIPEFIVAICIVLLVSSWALSTGWGKGLNDTIVGVIEWVMIFALGGKIANDKINKNGNKGDL